MGTAGQGVTVCGFELLMRQHEPVSAVRCGSTGLFGDFEYQPRVLLNIIWEMLLFEEIV